MNGPAPAQVHSHAHPHAHPHDHPHVHPHVGLPGPEPAAEPLVGPGGGVAVLDIGGDVGALVVQLAAGHLGSELHVRPSGRPGADTVHTGVWARTVGGREVVVAVFPELREGTYDVLAADGSSTLSVSVIGGQVAEATLP